MLIINADDWGRSLAETDAALECYKAGRITSAQRDGFHGGFRARGGAGERKQIGCRIASELYRQIYG